MMGRVMDDLFFRAGSQVLVEPSTARLFRRFCGWQEPKPFSWSERT